MKTVLGVSNTSKNRLLYVMSGCHNFVEDLVNRYKLPATSALTSFRESQEKKMRTITSEFYTTFAMVDQSWKEPLQQHVRHSVTRFAMHGFHHKLCQRRGFHEPSGSCTCIYCDGICGTYHYNSCESPPPFFQLIS